MAAPELEVSQRSIGRFGEFTAKVAWTQAESDNLDNAVLLSTDTVSGKYLNTRFAIEKVEWDCALTVAADIEFASLPADSDRIIFSISPDASTGEINWKGHLSGVKSDPERDSPGDVVITTRQALPGDELFITGTYREKGTHNPNATS